MLDNNVYQNHRQPLSNYPSINSHSMYNPPQSIYNNPLTSTTQLGNNYNNQLNMQTKTIPPTPPPDSGSRCMTPSNIKPGIHFY